MPPAGATVEVSEDLGRDFSCLCGVLVCGWKGCGVGAGL